jgi:putative acetyltransferase
VPESISIRPEEPDDHGAVDGTIRAAFAKHPDEVALLVERIRASPAYVPGLALLAEDASGVVGHVMLSFVPVAGGSRPELLILTPMSVRPDRQRLGVGSRLIHEVLARAEAAGEPAVLVEGIPAYYPRFGFERAGPLGFGAPHASIPDDAFMVKKLPGYDPALAGRVVYPEAFDHLSY